MMKSPHILLASSNVVRLKVNLQHILSSSAMRAIEDEVNANVAGLFALGIEQYNFGKKQTEWRQCISRLYYSAYSISRAIRLSVNGIYSTDSSDHKKISEFPNDFPNNARYSVEFSILREDRNLADYDHTASEMDLTISTADAKILLNGYVKDSTQYLVNLGVIS